MDNSNNFLTENYKNRLVELAGIKSSKLLLETDNRNIIVQKLGLPQEIAEEPPLKSKVLLTI